MIIDCFTFNKEFDLLESRMEYLNGVVDYFIIVEADITFTGIPREFQYVKQIQRYQKYQHKIIYAPLSVNTSSLDFSKYETPWFVERTQRNHIGTMLSMFRGKDKVLISDVDEIPSKIAIDVASRHLGNMPEIVLQQQMFYYNFNQIQETLWNGPIITTVDRVIQETAEGVRAKRNNLPNISNGGWHLSYWMSAEEISEKIKSFSHQEFNNAQYNNIETIRRMIREGKDVFNRDCNKFKPFDVNSLPEDFKTSFLKYVPDNC